MDIKHKFLVVAALVLFVGGNAAFVITDVPVSKIVVDPDADVDSRIDNGNISPHQPHNVHIMAFRDGGATGQSIMFGGGNIISARHVLTAAHLLVGFGDYQVGYGSTNLLQLNVVHPESVLIYPNYVPATRQNDIAIMTLRSDTTWDSSRHVVPIRFSVNTLEPQLGRPGTVAGFGMTFATEGFPSLTLRTSTLTTVATCAPNTQITKSHFCGMAPAIRPSNICEGDGGAGLYVTDSAGPLLVGLASVIPPGCHGRFGAGFTRVSLYSSWIQQNIK